MPQQLISLLTLIKLPVKTSLQLRPRGPHHTGRRLQVQDFRGSENSLSKDNFVTAAGDQYY